MKEFSLKDTNIAKGIAVCLMLIHHLFYDQAHIALCKMYLLKPTQLETFAQMCKVCVAVFVFLSGYGLYKSFSKQVGSQGPTLKIAVKFTYKHLKKLLSGYWWAVVPFAILGISTGMRSFEMVYGKGKHSALYFFIDFLGLGGRFDLNRMYNITCWYIALAIALYLLFPLLFWLLKRNVFLFCGFSMLMAFLPFPSILFENRIWIYPFA